GVVEAQYVENDIGNKPDDGDFHRFATNVVTQLIIDILPDVTEQLAVLWNEPAEPGEQLPFVPQHEKHHQRYQHQVDTEIQQADTDHQGPAEDGLAQTTRIE